MLIPGILIGIKNKGAKSRGIRFEEDCWPVEAEKGGKMEN